jgi:hypothetical protein
VRRGKLGKKWIIEVENKKNFRTLNSYNTQVLEKHFSRRDFPPNESEKGEMK